MSTSSRLWLLLLALPLVGCGWYFEDGPTVVREPGLTPRPAVVAIIPFEVRNADDPLATTSTDVVVWTGQLHQGCASAFDTNGFSVVRPQSVADAMANLHVTFLNENIAAMVGKAVGADAVVIGSAEKWEYSTKIDARIVRTDTAAVEATVHTENEDLFDGSEAACRAIIPARWIRVAE